VSSKSELLGELSKDGSELLSLSGYVDACDCTEGSVANNTCKAWGFRRTNVDARGIHAKLYKEKPVPGGSQHVRVVYTNANRALDLDSSSAKLQEGEFYLQFSNYIPIGFNTEALILVASSIFGKPAAQDSAAKTPPNANPENQTPSQAGTDSLALAAKEQAEATAEAIAEHQALAKQYEENAARWAADAANEKDPARREELQKRALEIRANASAERDIASSLSTGEFVRTRTDWDDQQQQRLVTKIHDELAQFDEAHRKQVEQLRAQKAEEMRGLVAQQKQAEEQLATVETELSAAETVQQGATMAMTIGALAVPGAGEVAMAYSVGTGYVEGGAPKAIETTVRMYSPYMDAAFSAYDGWKQIDPETGKQGGAFGALKGAAWNVVTNHWRAAAGSRGAHQHRCRGDGLGCQAAGRYRGLSHHGAALRRGPAECPYAGRTGRREQAIRYHTAAAGDEAEAQRCAVGGGFDGSRGAPARWKRGHGAPGVQEGGRALERGYREGPGGVQRTGKPGSAA
jgi:hypothetical protein